MSRVRSLMLVVCVSCLALTMIPALSGCGEASSQAPTPAGMTPEEAKAKADQETKEAFEKFQKEKKVQKKSH